MSQCIQRVYGERVTDWQCPRNAIAGKKYCKQHLLRHETPKATAVLYRVDRKIYDWSQPLIEGIPVISFTESTYIDSGGRRNGKNTDWHLHFDTQELALAHIVKTAMRELEHAREKVKHIGAALAKLHATPLGGDGGGG